MRIVAPANDIRNRSTEDLLILILHDKSGCCQYCGKVIIEIGECHAAGLFVPHRRKQTFEIIKQPDDFTDIALLPEFFIRKILQNVESQAVVSQAVRIQIVNVYVTFCM